MSTAAPVLSAALKKNRPHLETNALGLRMLRIRAAESGKSANSALVEILRRLTLSMAVFSFTLLGCTFGIEQGRNPSRMTLITALAFTLTILVSYFLGKALKEHPLMAILAFLLPHPLIWIACGAKLHRVAKGVL
jgi:lipopolysaccharide export system permease protein